ncbi:hypothetical protein [Micromonospora cremea]|uniref:DUF3558 domain-containing protein n=1 Tax=Micromonospora cremea TaxID=709881 RepID=A0A1N5VTN0_9ACTN|nr:hypothetical protein [Micromonospora cremea]SIM76343.1 hypothetical protein SAMN04489832_1869 [Micromonospora cremea]
MRWRIGYRLRNALIVGGTVGMGLFGWQTLTADVPSRPPAVDVCSLVRPETIARLVPEASPPTIEPGNGGYIWCVYSGSVGAGDDRAEVELWFGYHRLTRAEGESAVQRARDEARAWRCMICRPRPTPVRIGDESYEYGRTGNDGRQSAQVTARVGTVAIVAELDTPYASRDAIFEAVRSLAQEVAARCHARC